MRDVNAKENPAKLKYGKTSFILELLKCRRWTKIDRFLDHGIVVSRMFEGLDLRQVKFGSVCIPQDRLSCVKCMK